MSLSDQNWTCTTRSGRERAGLPGAKPSSTSSARGALSASAIRMRPCPARSDAGSHGVCSPKLKEQGMSRQIPVGVVDELAPGQRKLAFVDGRGIVLFNI